MTKSIVGNERYPADVRGYTYGVVAELNQKNWALRYGIFGEPSVANGPDIDPNIGVAHGQAVELETRGRWCDRPGKMRWMFYWNRATWAIMKRRSPFRTASIPT